jgi:hypothetical protein
VKREISKLFVGLSLLGVISCGGESTAPATSGVVGVFRARTIEGAVLPYMYAEQGGARYEITADEITINPDGTWSRLTATRATNASSRVWGENSTKGLYQVANGQVEFTQTSPEADSFTGSVDGTTMTVASAGRFTYVYQR